MIQEKVLVLQKLLVGLLICITLVVLQREVKRIIEDVSGLKTLVKVILHEDVSELAKAIAKAKPDVDYLQQLMVALEFEVEDLNENQQAEMPQVA